MKKNYLLFVFLMSLVFTTNAQEDEEVKQRKNAFAVSFGSPGISFEYARKLNKKLSAKIVYYTFNISDFEREDVEIKDDLVDLKANLEVAIIDLGIEYLPFNNSSFKLTAGLGYLSNVNLNAVFTYKEDVIVGTVVIKNENVGQIEADVNWSGIAPYVGIGFGRAIPKNRFGIGFEIGSYYTSSPDVNLTASNLLAPTAEQEDNLRESLESYKFIPKIQIRLAYNF